MDWSIVVAVVSCRPLLEFCCGWGQGGYCAFFKAGSRGGHAHFPSSASGGHFGSSHAEMVSNSRFRNIGQDQTAGRDPSVACTR